MIISKEIKIIREILGKTQTELAEELGVTFETINRWELDKNDVEDRNVEKIYNYAFSKRIYLNNIYEQFLIEENQLEYNKVLFHGCKVNQITFPISFNYSKGTNDFGVGFYLGESFKQAAAYISNTNSSSVYIFNFYTKDLNIGKYFVNKDWMLTIAYYRGWLKKYENNNYIKQLVKRAESVDLIIAPIADNRMFDLISEYVRGEITDLQCEHALAATNLGYQYVLRTDKSLKCLTLLKCCYVSNKEKNSYLKERLDINNIGMDKVKVARIEYRGKGQYIDEFLK